jgi:putative transposase
MPKIIRVSLSLEQRAELNRRARQPSVAPRLRDRLEMVRLSDLGLTIPQIAAHLDLHQHTVRKYLKAFLADGFAALPDRPIPGRPSTLTPQHLAALGELLDHAATIGQTWTIPHLCTWLEHEHGVRISARQMHRRLRHQRFRWKRTKPDLGHQRPDPTLQRQATADLEGFQSSRDRRMPT